MSSHVEGVNIEALVAAAEAGDVAAVRRLATARPNLNNQHHGEFGSALHRAVLRRDEELTRILMQLGSDARVGIWPHRDATSAYAIAVDREYSEIVAIIEREEDNRRARLSHGATPTRAAADALRQAIAEGRTAEAISLMEADPALIGACDIDPNESLVTGDGERSSGMALWFASMCGRHEIAELLLARGANVNTVVGCCGDALGRAQDEQMKALLLKHGARITVEQLPGGERGREIAKAILAGTMLGSSLDVANPTRKDLAEQMLWAAGDAEIVHLCLPHTTRPRDDPWWN